MTDLMPTGTTIDATQAISRLARFDKQAKFATAVALTRTAFDMQSAIKATMQAQLDRPTRFTLNSTFVRRATRANLQAAVDFRTFAAKGTPAWKYLRPLVRGGGRRQKRFERALSVRLGIPNLFAVPSKSARLNQFGNLSAGTIVQILSQVGALSESGFAGNETARSRRRAGANRTRYFVGRPGGRALGVYERVGRRAKSGGLRRGFRPVLIFVRQPVYRPQLEWDSVARRTFEQKFQGHFRKAIEQARATAR